MNGRARRKFFSYWTIFYFKQTSAEWKEKKNVYFAWNFPHSLDRSCLKVDFRINYQKTIIMDIKKSSWNCEIFKWSLLYQFTLMDSFLLSLFSDFSVFFLFSFPFKNRNFFFLNKIQKKIFTPLSKKIFFRLFFYTNFL